MTETTLAEIGALLELVGIIYDAALDPAKWSQAVEGACRLLDCSYGVIGSADLLRTAPNFNVTFGYEPADWQIYIEKYFDKNPLVPIAFRTSTGDILCRKDAEEAWQAMTNSEFYQDWAKRLGIVDILQATLDKTGSGIAMLSCARHERVGPAGPRELRLMATILPHLRRAVHQQGARSAHLAGCGVCRDYRRPRHRRLPGQRAGRTGPRQCERPGHARSERTTGA